MTLVSGWWLGLNVDHVYERCPARQRSLPELRRVGWDKQGRGELDVDDIAVCGWCRWVWQARQQAQHPGEPVPCDDGTHLVPGWDEQGRTVYRRTGP